MRTELNVLLITMLLAFAACGSSQKNVEEKEKAKQDSITKAAVQTPPDFKAFLQTFIKSVKEGKSQDQFVQKDIGVYVYQNPGAFCVASNAAKMGDMDEITEISTANIFERIPKGDFCEGYPGEKDGFYLSETSKDGLPAYYDMTADASKNVELPANLNYQKFVKVNVIQDEYFKLDLYFVCIDSSWYLIAQRFCDCSA